MYITHLGMYEIAPYLIRKNQNNYSLYITYDNIIYKIYNKGIELRRFHDFFTHKNN